MALHIFGAADALRERVGAAMVWPSGIAAVERCFSTLRVALDERAVADSVAEVRALSMAEAVALAATLAPPMASSPSARRPVHALTRRERDVLSLLAEHRTDREMAESLFLSPRTVNWHVRSILGKLAATSRREAVERARAEGLV
jgi:DNA-binding CsgD family transcriptional regulator